MASFSIANTYALRNYYSYDRNLVVSSNRSDTTTEKLNYVDSVALRRSVDALKDYDFELANDDDMEVKIRGFIDSLNYTLQSSSSSSDYTVNKAYKKLSSVLSEYSSELENIGITQNSYGYYKLSSSAIKNISKSSFAEVLNKDSDFMKAVSKYAKSIYRSINITI